MGTLYSIEFGELATRFLLTLMEGTTAFPIFNAENATPMLAKGTFLPFIDHLAPTVIYASA